MLGLYPPRYWFGDCSPVPSVQPVAHHGSARYFVSAHGEGGGPNELHRERVAIDASATIVSGAPAPQVSAPTNLIDGAVPWWMDGAEAKAGQTVRVLGRNLSGASVLVGGINPAVTKQTEYLIEFAMPSLTGPQDVTVGGVSLGAVEGKGDLLDPFGIGLGWADRLYATATRIIDVKTDVRLTLHCVGDGATNDAPAFREALALASSFGGATVYFPAGTYRIDDGTMCQVSNAVLKGEGKDLTTLQVGYRFTSTVAPTSNYYPLGVYGSGFGFANLTVQNLNGHSSENGVIRAVTANSQCFLLNCRFSLANGKPVYFSEPVDAVVRGCEFSATSALFAPLAATGAQRLLVEGNSFAYRAGRVDLSFGRRNVVRGNALAIDADYYLPGSAETGGYELSYGQELLVTGNEGGFVGAHNARVTDGELVNLQSSTVQDYRAVHTVSSVAGPSVAVSGGFGSTDWLSAGHPSYRRHVAQVLTGSAAGQWRWIASHDAGTMTLESEIPGLSAGDVVNVNSLSAFGATVADNELSRGMTAVMLYSGALRCDVLDNRVEDSGGIFVRADTRLDDLGGTGRTLFQPVWDCRIEGNTLVNSLGIRPACLSLSEVHVDGPTHPLMVDGLRIVGNAVQGLDDPPGPEVLASFDGVEARAISQLGLPIDPEWTRGLVIAENSVVGGQIAANIAFSLA